MGKFQSICPHHLPGSKYMYYLYEHIILIWRVSADLSSSVAHCKKNEIISAVIFPLIQEQVDLV